MGVKRCSKLWIMLVFRLLLDITCSRRNISETPFVKGAVDDWRLFSHDGLFLELFAAGFGAKLVCRVLHFRCLKASRAGPTSPSITTGCLQRGPSEQHTLGTFSTVLAIIPYEAEVLITLLIVNCLYCDEQLFTIKLKKVTCNGAKPCHVPNGGPAKNCSGTTAICSATCIGDLAINSTIRAEHLNCSFNDPKDFHWRISGLVHNCQIIFKDKKLSVYLNSSHRERSTRYQPPKISPASGMTSNVWVLGGVLGTGKYFSICYDNYFVQQPHKRVLLFIYAWHGACKCPAIIKLKYI